MAILAPRPEWRGARIAAIVVLAAMLAAAVAALVDEWRVYRASQRAAASYAHPLTLGRAADPAALPPRAALFEALAATRYANATREPEARAARFAAAEALIRRAIDARTRWGAARAVEAYFFFLRDGADAATTRAAYARSYADARFLPDVANWRIAYGIDQWPRLSPETKARLIDEMSWYATTSSGAYFSTMLGAIGTPAEVPFMRRRASLTRERPASAPTG